jgi:uncharacterized protein YggT (Ycf19 family)
MDDYEKTTRQVRVDEPIGGGTPVVAGTPVVEATPAAGTPAVVPVASPASGHAVVQRESTTYRPSNLEMARRVITLIFGILQGLIILRIVLLLLVANRDNGIVQAILNVTGPFVSPFRDMFSLTHVESSNGSVLDVGAIVALIAWTIIEALVLAILRLGSRHSPTTLS